MRLSSICVLYFFTACSIFLLYLDDISTNQQTFFVYFSTCEPLMHMIKSHFLKIFECCLLFLTIQKHAQVRICCSKYTTELTNQKSLYANFEWRMIYPDSLPMTRIRLNTSSSLVDLPNLDLGVHTSGQDEVGRFGEPFDAADTLCVALPFVDLEQRTITFKTRRLVHKAETGRPNK